MSLRAIRGVATTQIALMGQSNAVGMGGAAGPVTAPGELWVDGVEVFSFATQSTSIESLLSPNRRVTKHAGSGTGITSWLDTRLATAIAHAATAGIVPDATVWVQGEADSTNSTLANAYAGRLTTLLDTIDAAWGAQTLVLIPLLSGLPSGTYPEMATVNAAFATVAAADSRVVLVETADLEKQGDDVHYTRRGYDHLAIRVREALVERGL